ncbi:MAG: hypothetical protein ACLVI9_04025 [Anaerostipes hadrus]
MSNVDDVRDDIALMVSGSSTSKGKGICSSIDESVYKGRNFFSNGVYGFLTYENGKVSIPNKELMDRFEKCCKKNLMGYVYQLAKHSRKC